MGKTFIREFNWLRVEMRVNLIQNADFCFRKFTGTLMQNPNDVNNGMYCRQHSMLASSSWI